MNAALRSLVGDVDTFLREHWSVEPARGHATVPALITEREIVDAVDSRQRGATAELHQVDDWHPAIRALVQGLRPAFDGEVRASVYLAPEGGDAIGAGDGGPHMFVIQVAGCSEWTVGGWDVLDERLPLHTGEVLYVPSGWLYRATVPEGPSLLVTVTVAEPTVADIVDVVVADLARRLRSEPLASSHHRLRAADKADRVLDEVTRYCAAVDVSALVGAVTEPRASGPRPGR